MASRSKQKGDRAERKLVEALRGLGLEAARIPLSGAAGGHFKGDVRFRMPGDTEFHTAEVKSRADGDGWKEIIRWLGNNELLALYRDRADPLIVLPWDVFRAILIRLGADYGTRASTEPAQPEGQDVPGAVGRGPAEDCPVPCV